MIIKKLTKPFLKVYIQIEKTFLTKQEENYGKQI